MRSQTVGNRRGIYIVTYMHGFTSLSPLDWWVGVCANCIALGNSYVDIGLLDCSNPHKNRSGPLQFCYKNAIKIRG